MFLIKAHLRHLRGRHTPILDPFLPGVWCYICGKKMS